MKGEQFPLGPDARSFVSKEHFPGHDDEEDFDLTTEERANIMAEKNAIEDAILDNIDHPYLEGPEFVEDMRGVEEEDRKTMGWKTNFKSTSGGIYPNESEAEILDTAIKESEKIDDYDELGPQDDPITDRKKAVGKRDWHDWFNIAKPNNKKSKPRLQKPEKS